MIDWGARPPLGAECHRCHEPIREGDRGGYITVVSATETVGRPLHRECAMLSIIGHSYGVCRCTNYAGTPTIREAALELDLLVRRRRRRW